MDESPAPDEHLARLMARAQRGDSSAYVTLLRAITPRVRQLVRARRGFLSESDVELIRRVGEQADKVVVILLSGRPLIITDALPLADAWVAAWLPGTEGQGIADDLFGDHPFTGTLPYTWPASMDQLPLGTGDEPLFPFGYGLTTED